MRHSRTVLGLVLSLSLAGAFASPDDAKDKDKDKDKDKSKPPHSYTNDDLKKYKPESPPEAAPPPAGAAPTAAGRVAAPSGDTPRVRARESGGYAEPPKPIGGAEGHEAGPAPAPATPEPSASPEEADWKHRAAEARGPLRTAEGKVSGLERQMADLREQLNPMSTRYVLAGTSPDVAKAFAIEGQIHAIEADLVEARKAVTEAQKGWAQFVQEARAAGASSAWLEP